VSAEPYKDERQIKSYVWFGAKCFFVSTILRASSASEGPTHYNETMVWPYDWSKAERGQNFIFQDGDTAGSIRLHLKVCERNHHAKLTAADVIFIRQNFQKRGRGVKANSPELAKRFGIAREAVVYTAAGTNWQHLPIKRAKCYENS